MDAPPTTLEQLASLTAETDRYREQAKDRAAELSELRALLGEAELRREEGQRLLRRLRAQDRLIAELRPQAASNRLALQALRRLQDRQAAASPDESASVSAPSSNLWSKSIRRLLRGQAERGRT